MPTLLQTLSTAAGLGLSILAACPANAINLAMPLGARQAADALDLTQAVHCRRYAHRHGSHWGRGCDGGVTIISPQIPSGSAPAAVRTSPIPPSVGSPSPAMRPPGNYISPNNPQDRSGNSNPQDMRQPRVINPQDMR